LPARAAGTAPDSGLGAIVRRDFGDLGKIFVAQFVLPHDEFEVDETKGEEKPESQQKRLTDLDHENELGNMVDRLYGLTAALHDSFDDGPNMTPCASGTFRLLADVCDKMKVCADAFAAERQLREAGGTPMTAASRRSVLTALAAVPVAGVPALVDVADTSEPDPIFVLIDVARLAKEAHEAALEIESDIEEEAIAARKAKYGDGPYPRALEDEYPPLKAVQEKNDPLCGIQCRAEDAVLDAKPCALAGLAGQLIIAAGVWLHNEPDHDRLLSLLVNAARLVGGPEIKLPEELAEFISDDEDQAGIES
jgi:hypothetical protein